MNIMRWNSCLLFVLIMMAGLAFADQAQPLTQGSLYIGKTDPDHQVWLGKRRVQVAEDGTFAIGFDRDAKLQQRFQITSPDGTTQNYDLSLQSRDYRIQRIDGIARRIMQPNQDDLIRIRAENARVKKARKQDLPQLFFTQTFIWPLTGPITGVYGSQRVYNGEPRRPHYGVDVAAPTGTVVVAPADAVITFAELDLFFSGGTLIMDHGHGVSSSFLHLSKLLVKAGETVRQGQPVAEVGATGRVTGAHLDWRMNWFEQRIDPTLLVPPMSEVLAQERVDK
ncbi:M23 family metallopeptidase [Aestuariirhabdus sp. Z084]|uniref:M23 family metallopeptidase n=1 Tax=Aestuariirhabdus haliotis TaxID=2918751 RepID=UPI00201B36C2|nr:M23 family metallopeptidase [Aestuariirhabdus haliotis]MCL6414430.1 M23 family metallopeptidase [Aestuariirhabdus haliotis]MCL6418588.1 M23 family metallopeptidase [Aestuariirhabdus haliotis]